MDISKFFESIDFSKLIDTIMEMGASFGVKLIEAVIVLLVGFKLVKVVKKFLRQSPKLSKLDAGLRTFLASASSILLYVLLIITVAMILGVPVTSFITILASCGVAIGLALQGSLSNLAGGIMILLFKPFKVGDFIEAAGETGTVNEISVMYTEILTLDNKRITIPNGSITNSVIENYSSEETRRVDLVFNTAYANDVEKVKEVIMGVIDKHPAALKTPEPFVRLSGHKESSLEYTVRIWCKSADYWDVYFDTMENVKKAFDENNIQIPYSQLDVHIEK